MDQLIILKRIFFFILITFLVDIVLILWGEILSWSFMGVKGLTLSPYVILQIDNENVQIYQAEVVILHVISHPILITKLQKHV